MKFCFSTEGVFISESSHFRERKKFKLFYLLGGSKCFADLREGCVWVTVRVTRSLPQTLLRQHRGHTRTSGICTSGLFSRRLQMGLTYLVFIWKYIQLCELSDININKQNNDNLDLSLVICKIHPLFLSCFVTPYNFFRV